MVNLNPDNSNVMNTSGYSKYDDVTEAHISWITDEDDNVEKESKISNVSNI